MRAHLHRAFGTDRIEHKWWVLSCTSLGMLLATINSGTLIIALPDLELTIAEPAWRPLVTFHALQSLPVACRPG